MEREKTKLGDDGFFWFFGVVEDVNDPKKLGRVRVRILGDHTQDKREERIPTDGLPWAYLMNTALSASMNGIGDAPVGLVPGSWVVGFYIDAGNKQQPMIIGSFGGIPETKPDGEVGFNDPEENFPMESLLNEPDTNRLTRNEKEHEATKWRKNNILSNVCVAIGEPWDEPITPYDAEYPYNKVWEGWYKEGELWGHLEEWDSTPGKERYLRQHKNGNFLEIHPNQTEVRKIIGESYEIDLDNKMIYIKGDYYCTVKGDRHDFVGGNWYITVGNDIITEVGFPADGNTQNDINKKFLSESELQERATQLSEFESQTENVSEFVQEGKGNTITRVNRSSFTEIGSVTTIDSNRPEWTKKGDDIKIIRRKKDTRVENCEYKDVGTKYPDDPISIPEKSCISGDFNLVIENDRNINVKHDDYLHVEHDRTFILDNDNEETISGNNNVTIEGDNEETTNGNKYVNVNGLLDINVDSYISEKTCSYIHREACCIVYDTNKYIINTIDYELNIGNETSLVEGDPGWFDEVFEVKEICSGLTCNNNNPPCD